MSKLPHELIDKIILYTDLETCLKAFKWKNEYIIKKIYDKKIHTLIWAAGNGHLETLKWLYNVKGLRLPPHVPSRFSLVIDNTRVDVMNVAAANGHLEVLKWLLSIGGSFSGCAVQSAAWNNHYEVLEWLLSIGGSVFENFKLFNDNPKNMKLLEIEQKKHKKQKKQD